MASTQEVSASDKGSEPIFEGNFGFSKFAGEWAIAGMPDAAGKTVRVSKRNGDVKVFELGEELGRTNYGAVAYRMVREIATEAEQQSISVEPNIYRKIEGQWMVQIRDGRDYSHKSQIGVVTKAGYHKYCVILGIEEHEGKQFARIPQGRQKKPKAESRPKPDPNVIDGSGVCFDCGINAEECICNG